MADIFKAPSKKDLKQREREHVVALIKEAREYMETASQKLARAEALVKKLRS